MRFRSRAFSLLELLITLAIIGIVSAVALPAYQTYIETANMSKVNAAYENAIRVIQQEFSKDTTRVSIGLSSTLPTSVEGWKEMLNPEDKIAAPGGGPMYEFLDESAVDYSTTGAVRITMAGNRSWVDVYRPSYLKLTPLKARIRRDRVSIDEL